MNTDTFARSALGKPIVRLLAAAMESRLRYRFFGPDRILRGVDHLHGRTVLEVGCGTGYFTIPAGRLIGDDGSLLAIDIVAEAVELVSGKVRAAGLQNVRVAQADALRTGLDDGGFDTVLLFGVIPAPMLPVDYLLRQGRPDLLRGAHGDGHYRLGDDQLYPRARGVADSPLQGRIPRAG